MLWAVVLHNDNLLTTSGAARLLGVAEGTIRQMVRRGTLPAVRIQNGLRLFDRDTCEQIARERLERRHQPTQECS